MIRVIVDGLKDTEASSDRGSVEPSPVPFDPPESDPSRHQVKIVGVGGCGCNMVNRILHRGVMGAEVIMIDTDAQHLLLSPSCKKVLLGRSLCQGEGAKGDVALGLRAAANDKASIVEALGRLETAFIICGLGGGTGSGAAPMVAEVANAMGVLTVVLCTLPCAGETSGQQPSAELGLTRLSQVADAIFIFPNERLLETRPLLSLCHFFSVPCEMFVRVVRGITEGYAATEDKAL